MKNLKFLIIAIALLISSTAFAASNLWEFYNGELPSIAERAELYDLDDEYKGTAEQNTYLLGQLQGEQTVKLGASTQASDVLALFTTSLASKITNTATSLTLTSAIDKDGTTLASSTYGFIIDEGTATEELILADCTGTTCTNLTRGLSVRTGTTTVSALRYEHRRGAEIKITDAPALIFAANVFRGRQNIENKLKYNSNLTFTQDAELISKKYVDDTAFSGAGVIDASATARGVVELATTLETASSTASGGSGILAIPASNATSTYNSATAPLRVVVTQNNGKIDPYFISTSTLLAPNITFSGSETTITGSTTIATCITCGNSVILLPATQLATTSFETFIPEYGAMHYRSTATSTFAVITDNTHGVYSGSIQVPKAVTQLTGIKLLYARNSTGNAKLYFPISYASTTYPTTPITDGYPASSNIAGSGTDGRIDAMTVPSTAFDAITSVSAGGLINFFILRDGQDGANDTYNADLLIYGVQFTFN